MRLSMRFKLSGLAALGAVAFALPAWAHHSHGNYVDTFMDVEGVVTEVHLLVPHSWIYLEVKDAKGETQMWALEATNRTGLERIGVTPTTSKWATISKRGAIVSVMAPTAVFSGF